MFLRKWCFALIAFSACALARMPGVTPKERPRYAPDASLTGELTLMGSDSMDPLVLLWVGEFKKLHSSVQLKVVSKGSATAPPALLEGKAQLGHMSRAMNAAELSSFRARFGADPIRIRVAIDALAVFVHKDNPLKRMTMEQLDAIYSSTRKVGWEAPVLQWGDMGLKGEWRRREIVPYGRDENSGTRAFFVEQALGKGELNARYRVPGDQWAVVEAPGKDLRGISYGPINYGEGERSIRPLPLVPVAGLKGYLPTQENILSGKYPLRRVLGFYAVKNASREIAPLTKAFLRFVLSKEGQSLASSYGAIPVPQTFADEDWALLNDH
jgi:phosphate transport system substrate-binding protein